MCVNKILMEFYPGSPLKGEGEESGKDCVMAVGDVRPWSWINGPGAG